VLQHDGTEGLLASFQVYILPSPVYTPARAWQDAEFLGHWSAVVIGGWVLKSKTSAAQ
jgi:hypothetical protein